MKCDPTYKDKSLETEYGGEFKNGIFHGQGTYTYKSKGGFHGSFVDKGGYDVGWKYVGDFKNGNMNGQGSITLSDTGKVFSKVFNDDGSGNVNNYEGECKNGKPNGNGSSILKMENKNYKYDGERKNGIPHGKGKYTWPTGVNNVGEIDGGKYEGQGTFNLSDGNKFVGIFWYSTYKIGTFFQGNKRLI